MKTQGWQVAVAIGLGMSGAIAASPTTTSAQVVADPSIGTIVTPNGTTFQITNGTTVGRNLFHSFSRFDVPTGGVADFLNSPTIVNIFSRVTGGTASQIDGILRSAGTANLFLMNPSGIVFRQNARLDVGGSFVATTANAIRFGDRGVFSASPELPSPLLTVDPSAFLFNQINVAPIQSNSSNLGVREGQSLLLLGGDVTLDNSSLSVAFVAGGRIELGGLAAPSKVDLAVNDHIFRLSFPKDVLRSEVILRNGSTVDVTAGNGGSIAVNAQNLMLQDGSSLNAGIAGGSGSINSRAGDIDINATNSVVLEGGSGIYNHIYQNNIGNGGNINIQSSKLIVRDSQVGDSLFGSGNGGNLIINASDSVELSGEEPSVGEQRGYPGGLFAQIETSGIGQAGNLSITTKHLSVSDGSKVQVASFGRGNAGNLLIRADEVDVFETARYNFYDTRIDADLSGEPFATELPQGSSGNLTIETGRLSIRGGAVSANTEGVGNAGKLLIRARDLVELVDTSTETGTSSLITADVMKGATGRGGDLTIETRHLSVQGGQISASTLGEGDAGNLTVRAFDSVELSGEIPPSTGKENGFPGGLFAQVDRSGIGRGGNLTIETKRLDVSDGSKVQVATFGQGSAGNLFIHAEEVNVFETAKYNDFTTTINAGISLDPRTIVSPSGSGGNITIETDRLSLRNGGRIGSSTEGIGNAGNIFIQARDSIEVVGTQAIFGGGQISRIVAVTTENAQGNGGNITIKTGRLSVREGGRIAVNTFGNGNAGVLSIDANDLIEVAGRSLDGEFSQITAAVEQGGTGLGGRLEIGTGQLSIRNGGIITSRSEGSKDAGNININVSGNLQANDGTISTNSIQSGGGDINITARNIILRDNSDIKTFSLEGDGGNITLSAKVIVALEDSDILAFAPAGKGGNITFNTRAFLSDPLYRPSPSISDRAALNTLLTNGRVDVNASGTVSGTINGVPDISFLQNSLTQLPTSLTDTTQLLANSCIVRSRKQNGKFFITGSGGLPVRPGDAPLSPFPTGEVRSVRGERDEGRGMRGEGREETYVIQNSTPGTQDLPDRPWKIGDPIVEPQGVYRLANGELVMSRECK